MTNLVSTRRSMSVCFAALVLSLAWCEQALAGTYVMRSCNVPGSARSQVAPWQWMYALHSVAFDDCGAGGGFGLMFPNTRLMTRVSEASVLIARPSTGPRSAITIRRARVWMITRLAGTGSSMFVVTKTTTTTGGVQLVDLFGKPGGNTLNTPYESPLLPQNLSKFQIVLACSGSTPSNCYPSHPRPLEIRGVELTLEEDVPPVVELKGGTVTSTGPQSGALSVSYTARDDASGVAKVEGLLGDTVVGVQNFAGHCRYADLNACPAGRNDELVLNTRLVPDGSHVFRLRVTDAAGNRIATQAPGAVVVDNGGTTSSNPRLVAQFVSTRRSTATTRYGRPATIRGQLTDSSGHGIGNGRIHVLERRLLSGKTIRAAHVSTRSNGRFSYRVSSRGPSRSVRFQFRTRVDNANTVVTRTLKLRVRAASTLRVALSGVSVRYRGTVTSKPFPRGGKLVLMQGRVLRGTWQTFATRRTSSRGRFTGRYRLRVYRPGVTLQFRVRIPAEKGYPYSSGVGRTLTRKVR